jgi:hypothetical protein
MPFSLRNSWLTIVRFGAIALAQQRIKGFTPLPKLPSATSFIRETLGAIWG